MIEDKSLIKHINFLSDVVIDGYHKAGDAIKMDDTSIVNDNEIPKDPAPYLDNVIKIAKDTVETFNFINMSDEDRERRIRGIFTTRKFFIKDLFNKNENGSWNYDEVVAHIKFLEAFRKDIAAYHQAYELVRREFVNSANAAQRAEIAEKDKKYKPIERTIESSPSNGKLTELEKKIRKLTKLGISREAAEKILLGKKE